MDISNMYVELQNATDINEENQVWDKYVPVIDRLIWQIFNRFYAGVSLEDKNDMRQTMYLYLYNAIPNYDSKKCAFSTFVVNTIKHSGVVGFAETVNKTSRYYNEIENKVKKVSGQVVSGNREEDCTNLSKITGYNKRAIAAVLDKQPVYYLDDEDAIELPDSACDALEELQKKETNEGIIRELSAVLSEREFSVIISIYMPSFTYLISKEMETWLQKEDRYIIQRIEKIALKKLRSSNVLQKLNREIASYCVSE